MKSRKSVFGPTIKRNHQEILKFSGWQRQGFGGVFNGGGNRNLDDSMFLGKNLITKSGHF